MMTGNLLQSALRYAKQTVIVSVEQTAKGAQIICADDGPGIPVSDQNTVFQPFNRADKKSGGYGLGLAIVARIAEWHNATITIDSCPVLHGARFTISFHATG